MGVVVDFESWVRRAVDQVTRHSGMDAGMQGHGGIFFVGCTINIVTGGQERPELPGAAFGADAVSAAMPTAVRPMVAPGAHSPE